MRRREFITLLGGAVTWPLAARAGYVKGRNLAIEFRWAETRPERCEALVAELLQRRVTVIVTGGGGPLALAAKAATSTIPIVFIIGADPVEVGLVGSLSRLGAGDLRLDGARTVKLVRALPSQTC
jgi:putative ABC transport system substrate-binding protein